MEDNVYVNMGEENELLHTSISLTHPTQKYDSGLCVFGQFVSNDLDNTKLGCLKLISMSNQLEIITSMLHVVFKGF